MEEGCELWEGNERKKKNEMGEGECMCVVGENKKERKRGTWVVGKKKKKREIKKELESGVYVYGGKKWGVEKKEKKIEREKTKLVLFVCSLCLV